MEFAYNQQALAAAQPGDEPQASGFQTRNQQHSSQGVEPRNMASIPPSGQDVAGNRCQADGCMADLSGLRRYFRRYHVCETHIRSQVVHIGGREVRFCDQCSTFHALALFDGARRTCREKLEQNRLRRKIRKAQNAGLNIGGQQGGSGNVGLGPGGGNAAVAAAGSCDDPDSDDQPGNGGLAAEGDDMNGMLPTSRGQSLRGRDRKRPSGLSVQGLRRQQPAPRQGAGSDVTRALHVNRPSGGHYPKAASQSPEPEEEEIERRTPLAGGGGVREDGPWIVRGIATEAGVPGMVSGGAFGGGELDSPDAGLGGTKRGVARRAIELSIVAPEWPRLNHHDLRDQEQLMTSGAGVRDGAMYPPQPPQQQQHVGHQEPHGHWLHPPKPQHQVPLPPAPQQPLSNWEAEAGGVVALECVPNPLTQAPWRLYGGSMPNIPSETPGSPNGWRPAAEARATWPSVPAMAGPGADAPPNGQPLHDRSPRDGALQFMAGAPGGGSGYHRQQGPQALTRAAAGYAPALNGLGDEGAGRDVALGQVGPGGTARMPSRLVTHLDEEAGAPAVTLLSQVRLTEAELHRRQPRPSQTTPEPLSPVKLNATDMPGAVALPPAQKAALQLKIDAGLFKSGPDVLMSAPQADRQWAPMQPGMFEQQEHRGMVYGRGDADAQDAAGWVAATVGMPQTRMWAPSHEAPMYEVRIAAGGTAQQAGGPTVFGLHNHVSVGGQGNMVDERRRSGGSSVYTGDEAAAGPLGPDEQEVDMGKIQQCAKDAAEGKYMAQPGVPANLEACPSILEKKSFLDDVQSAMNDTQRWTLEQQQQQQLQQQLQQPSGLRDIQVVVNIIPTDHQLQQQRGFQNDHEQSVATLIDHIKPQLLVQQQQEQQQRLAFDPPQREPAARPQQQLLPQHGRPLAAKQQDALAQSFGQWYNTLTAPDKSHIHLSAFHIQRLEDLDVDSDHQPSAAGPSGQWSAQAQFENIAGTRSAALTAGAHLRDANTTAAGGPMPLGRHGAGAAIPVGPLPQPRQPQVSLQQAWLDAADASGWRDARGDGGCTPAFETQTQPPPSPSPHNHPTQQAMQQPGSGLGGDFSRLHPSDQELIRSTLESLAAQAPPFLAAGQHRQQPASEGRDRAVNGDGPGVYAPRRPGHGEAAWSAGRSSDMGMVEHADRRQLQQPTLHQHQPPQPFQLQEGAPMALNLRQDLPARNTVNSANPGVGADAEQQVPLLDQDALPQLFSVQISDLGPADLVSVDSVLFTPLQEEHGNGDPAAAAADGGPGMQGGPPTPPPHGGDGGLAGANGGGGGGFNRTALEGGRWLGSTSERQILAGLKQLQQQQQLRGAEYCTNDAWMAEPGGADVLRAWSWQQQQQQRQERAASHMTNDRQQQQHDHQQQSYLQQQWNQQRQQQDDPHSFYGAPNDAERATWPQDGYSGGRQNLSHVAVKLSHARVENLSSNMLEQMQGALRGGGTAALPSTFREGCVEVLVEVMHRRPAAELCKELFCLPTASSDAIAAPVAAMAASEQLRGWVGHEVFDACERVTMQMFGGPVLDCRKGERPQLRHWDAALQQAGMAFALRWPGVLMLASGPPVLVADGTDAQQTEVYGPAEIESQLGLVRLCVRMAGGSASLGEVQAVALNSDDRATRSVIARTRTRPQRSVEMTSPEGGAIPDGCSFKFSNVHDGALVGCEREGPWRPADVPAQQPSLVAIEEEGAGAAGMADTDAEGKPNVEELRGVYEGRRNGPESAGPRPFHCLVIDELELEGDDAPPTFSFYRASGDAAAPDAATSVSAAAIGEATELFRSCFLTAAPLLSSQPSSPCALRRTHSPRHQHRQQQLLSLFKQGGADFAEAARISTGREQQQVLAQRSGHTKQDQQQAQQMEGDVASLRPRPRSRSADGAAPAGTVASGINNLACTNTPGPSARPVAALKCKSLNRQVSARRKPSLHPAAAAAVAAALSSCGLDLLSQRLSMCSSTTLSTAMTLNDRLSTLSSSTAFTSATTLYDRFSLRSEWSSVSTLTNFGGQCSSAGGACGAGAGVTPSGRSCEPLAPLPPASFLSGCSDRTPDSGVSSRTPTACGSSPATTWAAAPSGAPSPELGSPLQGGSEACQWRMPASALQVLNEAGAAGQRPWARLAERRVMAPAWLQTSFQAGPSTAGEGRLEPGRLYGLDAETPRLVVAPPGFQSAASPSAPPPTMPLQQSKAGVVAAAVNDSAAKGPNDHRSRDRNTAVGKGDLHLLRLQLPVLPHAGLALFEATGGHAVVACWPLLVVETVDQRNDLMSLWQELDNVGRLEVWWGLAADLGLVLGNLPRQTRECDSPSPPSGAPAGKLAKGDDDVGIQCQSTVSQPPKANVETSVEAPTVTPISVPAAVADRPAAVPGVTTSDTPTPAASETTAPAAVSCSDRAHSMAACDGGDMSAETQAAALQPPDFKTVSVAVAAVVATAANCHASASSPCDSAISSESAYPESWGTGTIPQSACEQAPAMCVTLTVSSFRGTVSSGCAVQVAECASVAAAAEALPLKPAHGSDCLGWSCSVSPLGHTIGEAPAGAADDSHTAGNGYPSACGIAALPGGRDGEQQEAGEQPQEEEEVGSTARPACLLRAGDEVSLASGLGSLSDEVVGEDDSGVAAVTESMAALKVAPVSGRGSVQREDAGHGRQEPSSNDGDGGGRLTTEVAALEGLEAADAPITAGGAAWVGPHALPVDTRAALTAGRPLEDAAAGGLSVEARAALAAAVNRVRAFVQKRELPALSQLLSRMEMGLGTMGP